LRPRLDLFSGQRFGNGAFDDLGLENGRRDSLLYLRVTTVFKLLRLVEQAVETGPWTHIEISKI
jgi:hypothetical protein